MENKEFKIIYNEITVFPIPFLDKEIKNITISTNNSNEMSKDKIITQAFRFHSQGNISEAVKYYQFFLDQGFIDPRVYSNYGALLSDLGKLKEAEKFHRKAIEIKPDFAKASYNLSNTLEKQGRLEEAEKYLRKAIEIQPDFTMAHFNLGTILLGQRELDGAERSLRKAIELDSNFAEAYSNLANTLKELGRLKEAEILVRKSIKLKSNFAEAYCNLCAILIDLGKLKEAETAIHKAINLKPDCYFAYYNLGSILANLGKLKEAETYTRKAIELKPEYSEALSNLADILKDLGKLKEAKRYIVKAIQYNPNLSKAYFLLSQFKLSEEYKENYNRLFSKVILRNQNNNNLLDIYFARTNILHKLKKFRYSQKYLKLANNLKLMKNPSDAIRHIRKSNHLLNYFNKDERKNKVNSITTQSIFIVGMPRSGSTLLESIISLNKDVFDLGEVNILEESFLEWNKFKLTNKKLSLSDLYKEKVIALSRQSKVTTNKYLNNYQYTGIISNHIHGAKIIHCFRNPLDNILSIYRSYFARGNYYSSSLADCAKVYVDQERVMTEYKRKLRTDIYDLNYDLLVTDPLNQIKALISWLGWQWDEFYLSPHLSSRSVLTASSVQVRAPINSKSIGGWKNYRDILQPAIEVLEKYEKYKNCNSFNIDTNNYFN